MALTIELNRPALTRAIDLAIASLKRSKNTATNPKFVPIIDEELRMYEAALNSITELKK